MRLDALRKRPWALVVMLGSLLGLATGVAMPPAAAPGAEPARDSAWQLPDVQDTARIDDRDYQTVRQASLWFAAAGGAGVGAKWKLVGVVGEGEQRTALVLVAGQPDLLRVHNGDPLPEGGQVVDVGRYGMKINIYGCQDLILRLYTPGQRSPAPDCGYASDDVAFQTGAPRRGAGGDRARLGQRPGAGTGEIKHRSVAAPRRGATAAGGGRGGTRPGGPRSGGGPRGGRPGSRPSNGSAPASPPKANR